ncbi:hypothetical protein GCM10020001_102850 [Nonomuraea salmonea]
MHYRIIMHYRETAMRQRRVIINTDAKNEADDQFAIVHGLLSPPPSTFED